MVNLTKICTGAAVRLSSDKMSNVCDGDELQLICNVTGMFLEWRSIRFLSSGYVVQGVGIMANETRQANSATVTIIRISDANTLPLSSVLTVSPVTADLNGTEITCTDLESTNSTSTIINVIRSDSIQGRSSNQ